MRRGYGEGYLCVWGGVCVYVYGGGRGVEGVNGE